VPEPPDQRRSGDSLISWMRLDGWCAHHDAGGNRRRGGRCSDGHRSGWNFSGTWILIGIGLFVVTSLNGMVFLMPQMKLTGTVSCDAHLPTPSRLVVRDNAVSPSAGEQPAHELRSHSALSRPRVIPISQGVFRKDVEVGPPIRSRKRIEDRLLLVVGRRGYGNRGHRQIESANESLRELRGPLPAQPYLLGITRTTTLSLDVPVIRILMEAHVNERPN
jgi:hypothetical protein